jgi:hypothetical protein
MKGYTGNTVIFSPCDWNPKAKQRARSHEDSCPNEATVCVGAKGQWHLCEECAALPRFNRFRSRRELRCEDTN